MVDADIRKFFDQVDQKWLVRFLEHRIADKRVWIIKWLKAGVLQDGVFQDSDVGTPQGAVISPILANIYLHYVLDLWTRAWRKRSGGETYIVRYADDFVVCFQYRREAERYLRDLRARLDKFGLTLHPDKTRLIEFGRFAEVNRKRRGQSRPETFDFLGFTHYCRKTRSGRFGLGRKPIAKRMVRFLKRVHAQLIRRMHHSVEEVGCWLGRVLKGWLNYYAVPTSMLYLRRCFYRLLWIWLCVLRRRSQRDKTVLGGNVCAAGRVLAGAEDKTPMAGQTVCRHARQRDPRQEPYALTRTYESVRGPRETGVPTAIRVAGPRCVCQIR